MSDVNCANCRVGAFKESLCSNSFCKKYKAMGGTKDFVELLKDQKAEAIPISWLKEKLTGHPEISYALTDAIITVIEAWEQRKEE